MLYSQTMRAKMNRNLYEVPELEGKVAYLAGPMSGHEHHNYPAFERAAAALRRIRYQVLSPAEHDDPQDHPDNRVYPWAWYLRRDLGFVLRCDFVSVLAGWESSPGFALEAIVARALGIPIFDFESGDEIRPGVVRLASVLARRVKR
jgi:nucleoside 2-deoxyribosyltransferase